MGYREIRRSLAFVFACGVAAAGPAARAADLCGEPICVDVTFEEDLTCAGNGPSVVADGIRVDLNGHTIAGSGTGIGILVTGRTDVTIMGGVIRNFAIGLRTNTSTDVVIKQMQFVDNPEAIDMQAFSVGNTVKNNAFSGSTIRAIMLRSNSRGNDIKDNTFTGNRIGVLIFGGVDNTLKDNLFTGSAFAGIRINVIATRNVIKGNTIQSNNAGVEFLVTSTGSSTGNELKGNTIALNVCGVKGPTDGNTLKDNLFEGNTADAC